MLPRGASQDDLAPRGEHRQRVVADRRAWGGRAGGVRDRESGAHRHDEIARARAGEAKHQGERGRARPRDDRDDRGHPPREAERAACDRGASFGDEPGRRRRDDRLPPVGPCRRDHGAGVPRGRRKHRLMPISSRHGSVDMRAALLPPDILPLFSDSFVRSCDLYEEYVFRLTLTVFRRAGLEAACAKPVTTDEAIEQAGFVADVARVPIDWVLRTLSSRSVLATIGEGPAAGYRRSTRSPCAKNKSGTIRPRFRPTRSPRSRRSATPTCCAARRRERA